MTNKSYEAILHQLAAPYQLALLSPL